MTHKKSLHGCESSWGGYAGRQYTFPGSDDLGPANDGFQSFWCEKVNLFRGDRRLEGVRKEMENRDFPALNITLS